MLSGAGSENLITNNNGKIENAYYLKATYEELNKNQVQDNAFIGDAHTVDDSLQIAIPTSIEKFTNYSTFDSFAFAPSYDDVSDADLMIEEIVRSVWFYPNEFTAKSGYFQRDDYSSGAPQLVTANLNTYSLKYYVSDNTSKIIETVYSNLLVNYDTGLSQFNRDNVVVDIVEITGNDLANKVSKNASEIVNIINGYDDDMADYIARKFRSLYKVVRLEDGKGALDYLGTGKLPSVIITDLMMPNMDGFELCKEIKKNKKTMI